MAADGQHVSSTSRNPKVPLFVGAGLLVVGVVVALLLLGGDKGLGSLIPGVDEKETPEFQFDVRKIVAETTNADAKQKTANSDAKPAAEGAEQVLHDFFSAAYLDPGNWEDGDYEAAFEYFAGDAAARAAKATEVLTAGTHADAFETIEPKRHVLASRVLLTENGAPISVVGQVTWVAEARTAAGDGALLTSEGQFVLEKVDGDWMIVSFSVQRDDKRLKAPTPPSSSASASASEEGA